MAGHDIATLEGRKGLKEATPQTRLNFIHTENCRVLPNRDALLERLPHQGVAAEIGVAFGEFTSKIISLNKPRRLYLIDAWESERYEKGMDEVCKKFKKQIERNEIVLSRGYSIDKLVEFKDRYFDWVYIDTNHSYPTTFRELRICDKKTKITGLIAGHDFCTGNVIDPVPYGVIEACSKFCVDFGWNYKYLALEPNGHFSFCLERL